VQEDLVRGCIAEGYLRDANKLVKAWGMTAAFPTLEADYEQHTMKKLLAKGLWGAASGFAFNNPEFQVKLLIKAKKTPSPPKCMKLVITIIKQKFKLQPDRLSPH
jgi:hypothetical protein